MPPVDSLISAQFHSIVIKVAGDLMRSNRVSGTCLLLGLSLWAGCGKTETGNEVAASADDTSYAVEEESNHDLVSFASQALSQNDFVGAESAIRRHLLTHPNDFRALELAGDIASNLDETESAIELYRAAVEHCDRPTESLLDKLAIRLMFAGQPFETLSVLQARVEQYPSSIQARSDLVGLAALLGLADMGVPSLRWLAQHGEGDPEALLVLANPRRVEPDPKLCRTALGRCPKDRRAEFSLARLDAHKLQWSQVAERLRPVLERHPDFLPAFTLYGLTLTELNKFDEIPQWQRRLPAAADSSPEYWLVAGKWAQHEGHDAEAARAFWEVIRLDNSGYPEALPLLLRSLKQIGHEREAAQVADHINKHAGLRDALKTHLERKGQSQRAAINIADAMMDLGRTWEAEGWARLAVSLPNDRLPDIRQRYTAIRSQLTVNTPWQTPSMKLAEHIDLSGLPAIRWVSSGATKTAAAQRSSGDVLFEDQAEQRGLIHTCEIAPDAVKEGHWIYQAVGGGLGVIDFDLDGWPDLSCAMLDGEPLKSDSSPNRLFRNLGGQFVDCTAKSNYLDAGFAQGIAIGDFNDDGFPDIFDANVGRNRLYQNNGDGTFQEVSFKAGLEGQVWTTSAVIADIDGDGTADLFETSYCGGSQPYEQPCQNRSRGIFITCPPLKFEAEEDRIWRGLGDGKFVNATDQWMKQMSPGRGLGVVAGLFDEQPGLDLYVANDMTVNHLWSGQPDGEQGFELAELGAMRGLGLSGRAASQASMGMAAGDPDGDGDIDFFLTHFADDHNTYYEQTAPGFWIDRSYPVGLSEPSKKLLGFGTEWVDFDNNGAVELIVANGHIDDPGREDIGFRMPPQLFRLDRAGRWIELDRQQLGDYFADNHLGRALATVDVDRDGRVDVAITHLYDPVSLLINRTTNGGQSIGLELKSTNGQRDAIGASVTTTVGGRLVTIQLTAGDGYMCSNQRRITLGSGDFIEASDLVVTWPSGAREDFGTLTSGGDYLLVEGSGEAYLLQEHP